MYTIYLLAYIDNNFSKFYNQILDNPNTHFKRCFREHLLQNSLEALLVPGAVESNRRITINDVINSLRLLREQAELSGDIPENVTIGDAAAKAFSSDVVAKWWSSVGLVWAHWLKGDSNTADSYFKEVEEMPEVMKQLKLVTLPANFNGIIVVGVQAGFNFSLTLF